MTFSPTKALSLASTLATAGPHSYYPTDAECVEAGELLGKACEEIERLEREVNETARDRDDFIRECERLRAQVEEDEATKDMYRRNLARCVDSRRNEADIQQALVKQRHETERQLAAMRALVLEACDQADAAINQIDIVMADEGMRSNAYNASQRLREIRQAASGEGK